MFGCGSQNRPPTLQELVSALQEAFQEMKAENEVRDEKIEAMDGTLEIMKEETANYRESVAVEIKHLEDKTDSLELKLHETSMMLLKDVDNRFETQDKEIESIIQSILDKQGLTDEDVVKLKSEIENVNNNCNVKADKLEDYFKYEVNETKENIKKDLEEGIKRIKFDIEENVVNLKDENEKTNCNLKKLEANFTTFKNDIRKTVINDMKENMAKILDNKNQITQNFTSLETQMIENERSFNDYQAEMGKTLTEKFCLTEQKHADLQENLRETF